MGLTLKRAVIIVGLASLPASACTPIMSAAFPAVMLAYLVWLLMSLAGHGRYDFCWRDSSYIFTVPMGCLWFSVPMLIFILPFAFLFLAFPMHLAVEFLTALFSRSLDPKERIVRLVYYGLPSAIVLVGGIVSKWMLYSQNGGWRVFLGNLSAVAPGFGSITFAIGIAVLARSTIKARRRAREALGGPLSTPGGGGEALYE